MIPMKIKFTLIDYIIIILVICAVVFAFIHITTDDSSKIQKTAFDASTLNKLPETYLNYYRDGHIVKAKVDGYNSTTGNKTTVNGTVKWIDEGSNVKVLIESNNQTYLTGLYKNVPNADIYLDKISLEADGSVYDNLTEFKIKPQNISSLNDLKKNLTNDNYDISATLTLDSLDSTKLQEIENLINIHSKKSAIRTASNEIENQLIISKADKQTLDDGDSVFGSLSGVTDVITIRLYNCSDSDIENIKNTYDVINIRKF